MPDDQRSQISTPEDDPAGMEAALRRRWRWPPGLEAHYEMRCGPVRRIRAARQTALLGVIVLLFAVLDAVNDFAVMERALPWRMGYMLFAFACASCLRRLEGGSHVGGAEIALNVLPAVGMMMLTEMIGEYAGPWADRYMMAAAFGVAAIAAVVPMTLQTAVWVCVTAALTYPVMLAVLPRALPLWSNWDLPVFAAGALGIAAFVAERNESSRRASFIHRRRHEISAAGLSIMNAELRRLSNVDPLTGMKNRRAFNQALDTHWCNRRQSLALAIFDVDWFKTFNDSAGHAAGDAALQAVARAAERATRRGVDVAARIGGEEFAVLMPGVDRDQAAQLAERLRQEVAALDLPHPGRPGHALSISVGVACCRQGERLRQTPAALIHDADKALYLAKAEGRNRVVLAAPLARLV